MDNALRSAVQLSLICQTDAITDFAPLRWAVVARPSTSRPFEKLPPMPVSQADSVSTSLPPRLSF